MACLLEIVDLRRPVVATTELNPSDRLRPLDPDQVVVGIDWARDDHAVAVVDAAGEVVERFAVAHTTVGLRELVRRLRGHGAREVAIERPDGRSWTPCSRRG